MTWSIIARDEATGRIGIAVATRFFAVGAMVPHIKTGVGAIASQAFINPHYGPSGLALLEAGLERRGDGRPAHRRRRGPPQPPAARHGSGRAGSPPTRAPPASTGAATSCAQAYSVAGNMLAGPAVLAETIRAYEAERALPFARRLIGGDAGGRGGRRRQARQVSRRRC